MEEHRGKFALNSAYLRPHIKAAIVNTTVVVAGSLCGWLLFLLLNVQSDSYNWPLGRVAVIIPGPIHISVVETARSTKSGGEGYHHHLIARRESHLAACWFEVGWISRWDRIHKPVTSENLTKIPQFVRTGPWNSYEKGPLLAMLASNIVRKCVSEESFPDYPLPKLPLQAFSQSNNSPTPWLGRRCFFRYQERVTVLINGQKIISAQGIEDLRGPLSVKGVTAFGKSTWIETPVSLWRPLGLRKDSTAYVLSEYCRRHRIRLTRDQVRNATIYSDQLLEDVALQIYLSASRKTSLAHPLEPGGR